MKDWQCDECGYQKKGDAPPPSCPNCGADSEKFTNSKVL